MGYEKPSGVQKKGIFPCIQGRDVICQAQSGTGKTATFSISILQRIDTTKKLTQALVLSPTRELANQSLIVSLAIGSYLDVEAHACIGGQKLQKDISELKTNPHLIFATPGRCLHMLKSKHLSTSGIEILVLDEMDVLLSEGFERDIYEIFQFLPPTVQVILVSATMTQETLAISKKFMRNPVQLRLKDEAITLAGIRQFYVNVEKEEYKLDVLCDIFGNNYYFLSSPSLSLLLSLKN